MRLLSFSLLARGLSSCALALATAGALHAAPLEVTSLVQAAAPGKTPTVRRFPFVTSVDGRAAARINNLLFIETFEVPAPVHTSYGLREVSEEVWQRQPEIDFQVQRNDGRIFSVMLSAEGCGAYCESYTTPYAFDAANGRHLSAEDLFTPAGRAALGKQLKTANPSCKSRPRRWSCRWSAAATMPCGQWTIWASSACALRRSSSNPG
ncbi:MAG: hypothetical protein NTZ64_14780 [Polaromonas sp.]|nr:hypothetical protein [Polaromonas sp.]